MSMGRAARAAPAFIRRQLSRPRALAWPLGFVLLAPVLVSLGYEVIRPFEWGPVGGDFAVLEIHLRAAMQFRHWLGPYSRFGWNHPGPLYYYALAPLYWLSSGATTSLFASAALITLGSATAAGLLFFRQRAAVGDRLAFALTFGAAAFDLWARRLPADPWNPVVTVLPFAAFSLACAAVGASWLSLLPACAFLHAFISQTHISYVPCATLMLLAAMALSSWHRRHRPLSEREPLLPGVALTVLVAVIAWLPVLIAELSADRSNLARIWRQFAGAKATPTALSSALPYAASRLQAPVLSAFGLSEQSDGGWALGLLGVELALLMASIVAARARKDAFVTSLGALALLAAAVCCWSCRHIGDAAPHLGYLTFWFAFVGMMGWLAIALAWLPAIPLALTRGRSRFVGFAVACSLLGGLSLVDARSVWARYSRMPVRSVEDRRQSEAATARVALLSKDATSPLVLDLGEGRRWDALAGLVLGLEKHGITPVLRERWRFMFGNGVGYAAPGTDLASLLVSRRPSHSARFFDQLDSNAYLYLDMSVTPPAARITVEAAGAEGDPAWVVDGRAARAGSPVTSPRVLRLPGEQGSVTLRLPGLLVGELDAVVDAGDAYRVEASADGHTFQQIAELPSSRRSGLHNRRVALSDAGPWRALRLSSLGSTGRDAISEVRLDPTRWGVDVLDARGTSGNTRLVADGSAPRQGSRWPQRGSVVLHDIESFMTFGLPATIDQEVRVEGVEVTGDGNDEYEISGSYDGSRFTPVGVMAARRKGGLGTRRFYFNDARAWSRVRLAPRAGDGRFSIAEVTPIVVAGLLIDFGSEAAQRYLGSGWSRGAEPSAVIVDAEPARLRLPLRPGVDHELELVVEAPRVEGLLALQLNAQPLASVALRRAGLRYRVLVPRELVRADNELELRLGPAGAAALGERMMLHLKAMTWTPANAS